MKTLVKPRASLNTKIYFNQSYRQNSQINHSPKYIKFYTKWKFLLITMSFFTFIVFSESPEIDENICNKFNNEQVCHIW